jgi:Leucine rich repeat
MDENKIETLSEDIFNQSPKLKEISLRENRLKVISTKLFDKNGELKHLRFQNNFIFLHRKIMKTIIT